MSVYPVSVYQDARLTGDYPTRQAATTALDTALRAGHTTILVTVHPPQRTAHGVEHRATAEGAA